MDTTDAIYKLHRKYVHLLYDEHHLLKPLARLARDLASASLPPEHAAAAFSLACRYWQEAAE